MRRCAQGIMKAAWKETLRRGNGLIRVPEVENKLVQCRPSRCELKQQPPISSLFSLFYETEKTSNNRVTTLLKSEVNLAGESNLEGKQQRAVRDVH